MAIIIETITGWKWADIDLFNTARAAADAALGLPIDDTSTTRTSMSEKTSAEPLDQDVIFYYCGENAQLIPSLGAPIVFDISIETPDIPE